ncbi:MAG: RNA polymerase sigma factor [Candidatus Dormibacteraeota bacterium]|uniref:RNA polymerase sigma factor n=1 Tax=Candidatus Amunia macphersoniae TaxID=3127014 RepID=A0A934KNJ2_9BACT|nr:RNA polymerase sigma factor [Candidatus Dormibacteraeota bacterium]
MPSQSPVERVFREEAGRLTASLVRLIGDFDLAEELVADALVEALEHWPRDGVPDRPGAWLLTAARRKGLDRLRREAKYRELLQRVAAIPEVPRREVDDRLRLIFTCCHPALEREAQVALTLRAVVGLTTTEIARAFLVPEATMAKRITRAKRKIVAAGIPYRIPAGAELGDRLGEVLTVLYLVFNEGHLATSGEDATRQDLVQDVEWLAGLLVRLLPGEPEPLGLLALIRLHLARWPARLDEHGQLVLLADQDRALWDRRAITDAVRLLGRATALQRPGPYQVQAAIAAVHCEATTWEQTDWRRVVGLYSVLAALDPSPVVLLNRAIALGQVDGPAIALTEVDRLSGLLDGYHLFHATRAVLLRDLSRDGEAADADRRAVTLTSNAAEQQLLSQRLVE